ncbi:hypothetical protein HJFPF1_06867 [Paramyrothecium foliicola]|nr:hypothetical protein HJFPF1_06867 [Paramyrothecium foliicola]
MSTSLTGSGPLQRGLLGVELAICLVCVSLSAVAYATQLKAVPAEHSSSNGGSLGSDLHEPAYISLKELALMLPVSPRRYKEGTWRVLTVHSLLSSAESTVAIAVLSLVICLVRIVTGHLRYLPRYVNIGYDLLLCPLWILSAAIQPRSDWIDAEPQGNHSRHICNMTRSSFLMSVVAVMLYGVRLSLEGLYTFQSMGKTSRREIHYDSITAQEIRISMAVELEKAHGQALSPVLAFFPETEP